MDVIINGRVHRQVESYSVGKLERLLEMVKQNRSNPQEQAEVLEELIEEKLL